MLEDNNNICDANVKRELRPSQYQCGIPLKRGAQPTAMKFVRAKSLVRVAIERPKKNAFFIYASKGRENSNSNLPIY